MQFADILRKSQNFKFRWHSLVKCVSTHKRTKAPHRVKETERRRKSWMTSSDGDTSEAPHTSSVNKIWSHRPNSARQSLLSPLLTLNHFLSLVPMIFALSESGFNRFPAIKLSKLPQCSAWNRSNDQLEGLLTRLAAER